jgi:hypothetical protein
LRPDEELALLGRVELLVPALGRAVLPVVGRLLTVGLLLVVGLPLTDGLLVANGLVVADGLALAVGLALEVVGLETPAPEVPRPLLF